MCDPGIFDKIQCYNYLQDDSSTVFTTIITVVSQV